MKRIKRLQYLLSLSLMMIIWLYADVTYSQSRIVWSVVDGGGGVIDTGNYAISDSIGQPASGTLASQQATLHTGFYGTNILTDSLLAQQKVDWENGLPGVLPGETLHYSIIITNFFDTTLSLMIQGALDSYVDYLAGTLYVNNIQESDEWFSDGLLDFQSDAVNADETLMLAFDVIVEHTAPLNWLIENTVAVSAYSSLNPSRHVVTIETNLTQVEVIPEASTFLLVGTGLFGILVLMRKRRK